MTQEENRDPTGSLREKLVEEITAHLISAYALGQHDAKLGCGRNDTVDSWLRDSARRAISLTVKAIEEGMRLTSEVGRDTIIGWNGGIAVQGNLDIEVEIGDKLIAFRPQPSQEEEE